MVYKLNVDNPNLSIYFDENCLINTSFGKRKISDIKEVLVRTSKTTGQVLLVAATAMSTAWVVTTAGLPQQVVMALHDFTDTPTLLVFIITIFLILLGMVMDSTPAILIFAPIFMPLIKAAGIDPVYFGIIMVLNLMIKKEILI